MFIQIEIQIFIRVGIKLLTLIEIDANKIKLIIRQTITHIGVHAAYHLINLNREKVKLIYRNPPLHYF